MRRASAGRRIALGHLSLQRGRSGKRDPRPRGHSQQGVGRAALLPDEPGHPAGRGRDDDRERFHRAFHQGASARVCGGAEPAHPAGDGRLRRLGLMPFTKESVEEIASLHEEPDWLRKRRREAFDVYERLDLPSKIDEEWRRVDFKGLKLDGFRSFEEPDGAAPGLPIEGAAGVLRQRGSAPGKVELDPELAAKGVVFLPLSQGAREHRDLVEKRLFSEVRADRDKFAAVHAALFSGGTFLYVPDFVEIEEPLVGQYWSSGGGAAVLPHTLIVAGKGAKFNYLDEFLSPSLDEPALTSGSAEIFLGEGAQVGYVALQKWGRHAYQSNRNLLLSKQAKAYSIPMLEIINNDVRCTHGATVGPIDAEHLFYLESRGIPKSVAQRMIVQGFFGEVADRIPFEQARRLVAEELEARLG